MKRFMLGMAIVMASLLLGWQGQAATKSPSKEVYSSRSVGYDYALKNSFKVKGRYIATDGDFFYVCGARAIYKYDKRGRLIAQNEKPFEGYTLSANLLGDIDVFDGELFLSAENLMNDVSRNVQIVVHDANTLKFKRVFKANPALRLAEMPSLCVDGDKRTLWAHSWVGDDNESQLYEFSLSGKYLRTVTMDTVPQAIQALSYYKGALYATAADGEAPDHLYRINISNRSHAIVTKERAFGDVRRRYGEIEGLTVDPKTQELLVLFNVAPRDVKNLRNFYYNHDSETSDVYRFGMSPR